MASSKSTKPQRPRERKTPIHFSNKQIPEAPTAHQKLEERPGSVESSYPTVALVGRPNVGKSSLFNALLRREISITDGRAGTTRDRVLHPIVINEKPCDLMDTGGIGIVDKQDLSKEIDDQIQKALHAATVVVLVVDASEGLTPLDREVAARLRKLNVPIVLVANKIEGKEAKLIVAEFSELGIDPVVATSAVHRLGLDDMEDAIASKIPMVIEKGDMWADVPRIAVAGRRNVGKSSFCNALAREERTIVSSIAGTTRDSVDILLQKDNATFCLVDTAGMRRMREPEGPVEFFAQVRTERAISRSDVVILMLSAHDGVSIVDRKIADTLVDEHKPCLIVVNKWDLNTTDVQTGDYLKYLEKKLPSLRHVPVAFTSALTGSRCWQAIDVALDLYRQSSVAIPTPKLNKAIERAEFEHEPPAYKGHKPRLLYGTQVGGRPPTFVIQCRHAEKIDKRYEKYLANRLRELLELAEVPVRLFLREAPR